MSILLELQEQEVLKRALSGRDEVTLEPILRFCTKYIANPRFSRVVCVVAEYLLDIYVPGVLGSSVIDDLYRRLANKLKAELQFQRSLQKFIVRLLIVGH